MNVSSCAGAAPNCGICSYDGPIENGPGQIDSHRCSCDSRVSCNVNADCAGSCACVFYFGSHLPLSSGGVSTCVKNTFQGSISGIFNEDTGATAGNALLLSTVFSGPTADDPCPKCVGDGPANDGTKGGNCVGGDDNGDLCDIMGTHPNQIFGDTSLDCRPAGAVIANLNIDLSNTTGSKTRTLSTANPLCTEAGYTAQRCHCDTCATLAAESCATNADCPGGAVCGGRRCIGGDNAGAPCTTATQCPGGGACGRPGRATAPNQCNDDGDGDLTNNCSSNTGDGDCAPGQGPFEQFCKPSAIHIGCASNVDCTVPGDTCVGAYRKCYNNGVPGNTVTATGAASPPVNHESNPKLAALFCIGPTITPAVNSVAGLPGLGRLELPGHATDNGPP